MVKLNVNLFRYIGSSEFRVLTAIEMGMKNHEFVPTQLINTLAKLKYGGTMRAIKTVHKHKLLFHDRSKYDGYKLTYPGYDFLALKALSLRGCITSVGKKIGVGKESDIYLALDGDGKPVVMKLHRLGRISFRSIKRNRDYLKHRKHASWLYLSRLAALKEYSMMKALFEHGFPVPRPIDANRHCVVMGLVNGYPLANIKSLAHPEKVYNKLMNLVVKMANYGLIHGDFNEFNIMISDNEEVTLIDFPQMMSTDHPNAKTYFDRDTQCLKIFFQRRFGMSIGQVPVFGVDTCREKSLDLAVEASGFNKELDKEMEELIKEQQESGLLENEEKEENDDKEEKENTEEPSTIENKESQGSEIKSDSLVVIETAEIQEKDIPKEIKTLDTKVFVNISPELDDVSNNDTSSHDVSSTNDSQTEGDKNEELDKELEEYEQQTLKRKIAKRVKRQAVQRERKNIRLRNTFKAKEKSTILSQAHEDASSW